MSKLSVTRGTEEDIDGLSDGLLDFPNQIHNAACGKGEGTRVKVVIFLLALSWLARLHYFPGDLSAFEFNFKRIFESFQQVYGVSGANSDLEIKEKEGRSHFCNQCFSRHFFLKSLKSLVVRLVFTIFKSEVFFFFFIITCFIRCKSL